MPEFNFPHTSEKMGKLLRQLTGRPREMLSNIKWDQWVIEKTHLLSIKGRDWAKLKHWEKGKKGCRSVLLRKHHLYSSGVHLRNYPPLPCEIKFIFVNRISSRFSCLVLLDALRTLRLSTGNEHERKGTWKEDVLFTSRLRFLNTFCHISRRRKTFSYMASVGYKGVSISA